MKRFFCTLIFITLLPLKAYADLVICNDTQSRIGVAIGYKDELGWGSEGWWNIPPESCEPLLSGTLQSQYYYVYALDYDKGGEWSGEHQFCVKAESFTIRGNTVCAQSGWEAMGFLRVDTQSKSNWVVRLGENQRINP